MGSTPQTPGQPGPMQAGEFTSLSQPSVVSWNLKNLAPPSPLYITRDDALAVDAISSVASETVTITARILTIDGIVIPLVYSFPLPTAYTNANPTIQLAEGFLLSFSAQATAATHRGQTYVRAWLSRGGTVSSQAVTVLASDYITGAYLAGWPNGNIVSPADGPGNPRAIVVGNPGAGNEINLGVQTSTRWKVRSLTATFITSGTAGNRYPQVELFTGSGNPGWVGATSIAVPATTTATIVAGAGAAFASALTTNVQIPLPPDMAIMAGSGAAVKTLTSGLLAGDAYSNIVVTVEEWFDGAI